MESIWCSRIDNKSATIISTGSIPSLINDGDMKIIIPRFCKIELPTRQRPITRSSSCDSLGFCTRYIDTIIEVRISTPGSYNCIFSTYDEDIIRSRHLIIGNKLQGIWWGLVYPIDRPWEICHIPSLVGNS